MADSGPSAHNVIFSGRSSWNDAKAADPRGTEFLRIVTTSGQKWDWKRPVLSDDSVSFKGKALTKGDVKAISYVRFKPMTSWDEYALSEGAILLAPGLWFKALEGKLSVTLFDSGMAEDNSAISCRWSERQ